MSAAVLNLSTWCQERKLAGLLRRRDWDGVADVFYARADQTEAAPPPLAQLTQEWRNLLDGIWQDPCEINSNQSANQRLAVRAFLRRHRPSPEDQDRAWEEALTQGRADLLLSLQMVLECPSAAALTWCGQLLVCRKSARTPLAFLPSTLLWQCLRVLKLAGWSLHQPKGGRLPMDWALLHEDWLLIALLAEQGAQAGNWANAQRVRLGLRHLPDHGACKAL